MDNRNVKTCHTATLQSTAYNCTAHSVLGNINDFITIVNIVNNSLTRGRMRDRKDAKFFEEKIKRRNILKFVILSLILTFFCDNHLNLIKSETYIEACKSH